MVNSSLEALGKHLIVELYNCDPDLIDNLDHVSKTLLRAADESGATVLKHAFHKFSPQGVTGVVVIAESHFSIHSWPEYGYCSVDIFSCGDKIDTALALSIIKNGLKSENISVSEIKRGLINLPVERVI